jgi:hypothetical protein
VTTSFLALYRGATIGSARLVAVASDEEIVREFAGRLLDDPEQPDTDPVASEISRGKQRALEVVRDGRA